jgi:uncharacterized protein YacL
MVLKVLIILACTLTGYIVGLAQGNKIYGLFGLGAGLLIILVEGLSRKILLGRVFGALIGIATGTLFGILVIYPLKDLLPENYSLIRSLSILFFGYLGLLIGAVRGKGLRLQSLIKLLQGQPTTENLKILDTSVIIDGRIADICETGFMEGIFIVPQFILRELQHIADSHDPLRRARGRRGLEDFPNIKEVDSKLIALAKAMNAKVITNDFNLNKVAEVQGVPVLNINELANALRPVVLPGEKMKVFIIKEGKEYNQGVAYLDDGTMVVVENGRRYIGKNVETVVTSVLQSTAGRMIFTRVIEESEKEEARTR